MTINMAGVKNVIRYIQDSEPTDQNVGDLWAKLNTDDCVRSWNGYNWLCVTETLVAGYPYGYSMGSNNYTISWSRIERITFPFDSGTASYVGNLSSTSQGSGGCNSSNYGYQFGGYSLSPQVYFSTIDRITFPFDSGTASHIGNLNASMFGTSGSNSSNYGYAMGGIRGTANISTIDRITFPFNSGTASAMGNMSVGRQTCSGCNSSTHGYAQGGFNASLWAWTRIDRLTFPFDSGNASNVGNLSRSKSSTSSFNSSAYGFCIGGGDNLFAWFSDIDRITFPFDSGTASHVGNLSTTTNQMGGCNSSEYGYSMGGGPGATVSTLIERITFPFDSGTASYVGNLSYAGLDNIGIDDTDSVTLFR